MEREEVKKDEALWRGEGGGGNRRTCSGTHSRPLGVGAAWWSGHRHPKTLRGTQPTNGGARSRGIASLRKTWQSRRTGVRGRRGAKEGNRPGSASKGAKERERARNARPRAFPRQAWARGEGEGEGEGGGRSCAFGPGGSGRRGSRRILSKFAMMMALSLVASGVTKGLGRSQMPLSPCRTET